jgi:predicted nucleic acid-binding protein
MAQVIDASVAIAWCAPSQATALTRAALKAVMDQGGCIPSPFWFEVIYGLAALERRQLMTGAEVEAFLVDLSEMALTLDQGLELAEMIALRELAGRHGLNIYDAAYLELALRLRLPLATRDSSLARAATAAGVPLFSASQSPGS